MPEGHAVTRDRARKKAIRARMAASGEPYNAAARKLDAASPVDDPAVTDEVVARANSTLATPRARIEVRMDRDFTSSRARPKRRLPRPIARLARSAAGAAWKRISPEMDFASVREEFKQNFLHPTGEGFVEPTADRYQIDFGGYAQMHFNGQYYGGGSGQPLRANNHQKPPDDPLDEPLEFLRKLRSMTGARHVGHETVRGTPCRVVAVRADSAEFTIWIDDEHIRRIQSVWDTSDERVNSSVTRTLELWDFGTADGSSDWTHLPSFRAAGHSPESAG
jgi:Predicted periplasmic protein (DUF2092)